MDTQVKKRLILDQIEKMEETIFRNQIMERYYQRRVILNKSFEGVLGKVQREMKENKEYLKFLEEIIKEY